MNTKEKRTIGEELIGTHQNTKSSDDLSLYDNLVVNHYLKKKLYFYDNDSSFASSPMPSFSLRINL